MKSKFFGGMFAGFFLACLFFFGVIHAKAQSHHQYEEQTYQYNVLPAAGWDYTAYYHKGTYYASHYHPDHRAVYYHDYKQA